MNKTQIMSRNLPALPLQLEKVHGIWEHPWAADYFRGDHRFTPPTDDPSAWTTVDGGEHLFEFMNVRNPEDAARFLSRFGSPFIALPSESASVKRTIKYDFGVTSHYLDMPPPRRYVYMRELLGLQGRLKQAAVASNLALPSELRGLQVDLQFTNGNLIAVCEESNGARAFFAQLFFEQLQGTTFGWCSRRDCGNFFRRTSKHAKKYCTEDCAHLVAVRNSRNRER